IEMALTHTERVRSLILAATHAGRRRAAPVGVGGKVPKDRPYLALYSEAFAREYPDHVAEDVLVGSQNPQPLHAGRRQWQAVEEWDAWDRLDEVRVPAEDRERPRRANDFAAADRLRDRIRQAGFDVTDTPSGWELTPRHTGAVNQTVPVYARSEEVPSVLDQAPSFDGPTVQWVIQGWPEDVLRSFKSVARTLSGAFQSIIVDAAGTGVPDWYRGHEIV